VDARSAIDAHLPKPGFHGIDAGRGQPIPRIAPRNPLFVLPIDDLDLNPTACLAVLNLLRVVSVPRLFTVVLGDLEVAEVVVNPQGFERSGTSGPDRRKRGPTCDYTGRRVA
jgi:hypothetical protein